MFLNELVSSRSKHFEEEEEGDKRMCEDDRIADEPSDAPQRREREKSKTTLKQQLSKP